MMRYFAFLFALLLVPAAAIAAPTPNPQIEVAHFYPFTCNLGGATNTLTTISGGIDKIAFSVSKGPAAAGLQPGQCAFEDRALRSTEPTTLCFTGADQTNMIYKGQTVIGGGFTTSPGSKLAQFLIFGGSSKIWNFTVLNSSTCFIIETYGV